MDSTEQCFIHRTPRQPSPTTICGKIGENSTLHDQRESINAARFRSYLGRPGRETRGYCEECA